MSLYAELRQRRIWRVVLAYPGLVFVLLQAIEFFINNFGWDHRFLTLAIIVSAVMLPAAVIWNWRHGEQGRQGFTAPEIASYALFGAVALFAAAWYWRVTPPEISTHERAVPPVFSLAVLPFQNVSGDAGVQYLCDGIAESLINWLSTVPDVRVASKQAAFRLRDHADDTAMLARNLGVDSVLRGRLEKLGDEIVISASLVDARDESQLWGDRMVQPLANLMELEQSIVAAIKDGLRLEVKDGEQVRLASGGTRNPEAYQHYLRGHFLVQSSNSESIAQGLDELRSAIGADPNFALPYADIANTLSQVLMYGMEGSEALRGEARSAAFAAVALAPNLAEAYTAMAAVHETITFDWKAAEESYEAAISLAPRSPVPYRSYADFLWASLRFERAIEMAQRALEIDPMDGNSMHAIGISQMYAGNFAAAAAAFREWNRFYPGDRWSYVKSALALSLNGQCDEAAGYAETAEQMSRGQGSPMFEAWLAWGYRACGREDLYAQKAEKLEQILAADPETTDPAMGFYFLLEGDAESLVRMQQRVVASRNPMTLYAQLYMLDTLELTRSVGLSTNPEFRELVRSLNYPLTRWSVTEISPSAD